MAMSLTDLRNRCEALATVGDEQARATLDYLFKDNQLIEENKKLSQENQRLERENDGLRSVVNKEHDRILDHARYVLSKIKEAVALAEELGVLCPTIKSGAVTTKGEPEDPNLFGGVKINGKAVDGVVPRPKATVPERHAPTSVRDPKPGQEASEGQRQRIEAIAKVFGIDPSEPAAAAAAHTRQTMGLPATPDTGVTSVTPTAAAGHYDKSVKMDKDGNKD